MTSLLIALLTTLSGAFKLYAQVVIEHEQTIDFIAPIYLSVPGFHKPESVRWPADIEYPAERVVVHQLDTTRLKWDSFYENLRKKGFQKHDTDLSSSDDPHLTWATYLKVSNDKSQTLSFTVCEETGYFNFNDLKPPLIKREQSGKIIPPKIPTEHDAIRLVADFAKSYDLPGKVVYWNEHKPLGAHALQPFYITIRENPYLDPKTQELQREKHTIGIHPVLPARIGDLEAAFHRFSGAFWAKLRGDHIYKLVGSFMQTKPLGKYDILSIEQLENALLSGFYWQDVPTALPHNNFEITQVDLFAHCNRHYNASHTFPPIFYVQIKNPNHDPKNDLSNATFTLDVPALEIHFDHYKRMIREQRAQLGRPLVAQ